MSTRRHSYAFQPIVGIAPIRIHSYEALIRGTRGEPAEVILRDRVSRAPGDGQESRDVLFRLAAPLNLQTQLNFNVPPLDLCDGRVSAAVLVADAHRHEFAPSRLVVEVTESERIVDTASFQGAVSELRSAGFRVALDDFGAGYAGLTLLADFQPDLIKLDMELVRGIEKRGPRQAIVRAILGACADLGIDVIAEGVESPAEFNWFLDEGVTLFQGYLFGRPVFEGFAGADSVLSSLSAAVGSQQEAR